MSGEFDPFKMELSLLVWCASLIALSNLYLLVLSSPITNPHGELGDIEKVIPDYFDSKKGNRAYHNSTPAYLIEAKEFSLSHMDKEASCSFDFHLKWTVHVSSPVYATPLIFPSGPEGRKEIFISTFYDFVEVLGDDGYKPWGWPMAFEDSTFLGSPILFDIDADGKDDVGVVDKNGNLFFIRLGEYGQYLEDFHTHVPRLRVKKDWAKGINEDYVDSYAMLSMFDHQSSTKYSSSNPKSENQEKLGDENSPSRPKAAKPDDLSGLRMDIPWVENQQDTQKRGPNVKKEDIAKAFGTRNPKLEKNIEETSTVGAAAKGRRRLKETEDPATGDTIADVVDPGIPDFGESSNGATYGGGMDGTDDYTPVDHIHNAPDGSPDATEHYGLNRYAGYGEGLTVGDDEYSFYGGGMGGMGGFNESEYVYVEPHVLASATLADVNGDGHMKLIIPVSYYFDKPSHKDGKDADIEKKERDEGEGFDYGGYVAGGILCWDLQQQVSKHIR